MRLRNLIGVLVALFLVCPAVAQAQPEVELAYVEWAETVASTNVVQTVLEDMGYDVEITPVSAAAMWQATATGDVDGFTGGWLPVTQGEYHEKLKDEVEVINKNLNGAKIGLAVPEYVEIDSIAELNANAEKFREEIIGIDPGAGIMGKAEKALDQYNMDNMELVAGSGATMTAVLKNRYEEKEPVVVTAWTPHWMFSRWDLKYLKDPKSTFGQAEYIATVVRPELKNDMPKVYNFLKNFEWTLDECQQVMLWIEDSTPEEAAERWVEENPEKVKAWKQGA